MANIKSAKKRVLVNETKAANKQKPHPQKLRSKKEEQPC